MTTIMARPDPKGSSDMFRFSYEYYKELEKIVVGERIIVKGFEDKNDLRGFASIILIPHSEFGTGKNYEYKINEKNLTYITERAD
jgi:hypothetical protein